MCDHTTNASQGASATDHHAQLSMGESVIIECVIRDDRRRRHRDVQRAAGYGWWHHHGAWTETTWGTITREPATGVAAYTLPADA